MGGIDFDTEDAEKPHGEKYMMLRLSDQTIELRTYGVDIQNVDRFASIISKLFSWARSRSQLLQQVLGNTTGELHVLLLLMLLLILTLPTLLTTTNNYYLLLSTTIYYYLLLSTTISSYYYY